MTGTWISKHSPTIRSDTSYPLERYLARFNELEFDPQAGEMVVIRRLIASRTTRASAAALTGDLMHFLRWARDRGSVFELTYDDAEDYVAAMTRRRYAGSTRLQRVSAARGFFEEALRRDFVTKNPFRFARVRKGSPLTRTPSLTKEEVEHCLEAIYRDRNDLQFGLAARRDYALVMLLAWTAIRSIEVERLRWMDFYFDREAVMARITGKGGKDVDVPVPADVVEAISDWREAFESSRNFHVRPFDPVFPSLSPRDRMETETVNSSEPLRATDCASLSKAARLRLNDIGVIGKRFGAHAFRATAATVAYAAGADVAAISRFLRHESLQTTQGYIDWHQAIQVPAQGKLQYATPAGRPEPGEPWTAQGRQQVRLVRRGRVRKRPVDRRIAQRSPSTEAMPASEQLRDD